MPVNTRLIAGIKEASTRHSILTSSILIVAKSWFCMDLKCLSSIEYCARDDLHDRSRITDRCTTESIRCLQR